MSRIHQTALVHPSARIGSYVEIGPYCFVGPEVEIGDQCVLHPRSVVTGVTTLGAGCEVFSCAAVGHDPQDMKYRGEQTSLVIGEGTVIRELVTLNRGTETGRKVTKVGSHCVLMPSSHVGHDCELGDHVTLGNGVKLAGLRRWAISPPSTNLCGSAPTPRRATDQAFLPTLFHSAMRRERTGLRFWPGSTLPS